MSAPVPRRSEPHVLVRAADRLFEGEPRMDDTTSSLAIALVREAVANLGWGTMLYRCSACAYETCVWLALGVEGPPALRQGNLYVACPFTVSCWACAGKLPEAGDPKPPGPWRAPRNGTMAHRAFERDEEFAPELIPDDAAYFALPQGGDCGRLVLPSGALVAARRFFYEGSDGSQ